MPNIKTKSQKEIKTSMFELPEFKLIDVMRNNGTLNPFSKQEIEEFFNAHDKSKN